MIMLALGAHVTTVEPASDLATAARESGLLNCWGSRHTVINAFACATADHGPRACMRTRRPAASAYRAGGGAADDVRTRLEEVRGITLESLLLSPPGAPPPEPTPAPVPRAHEHQHEAPPRAQPQSAASQRHYYDLIKLDADGPEGECARAHTIAALATACVHSLH